MRAKRKRRKSASALRRIRIKYYERYLDGGWKPGKASDYIEHIDELKRGDEVVLYIRVSSSDQDINRNLKDQGERLEQEMAMRGIIVIDVYFDIASGWAQDRDGLKLAAKKAYDHNASIVAESVARLLRNHEYNNKTNPNVLPIKGEFERLRLETLGVRLITLVHPKATPGQIRSFETRRGKQAKGNPGGRPRKRGPGYKKRIKQKYMPIVLNLYEQEPNVAAIARKMRLNYNTVYSWIRKFG